MGGENSSGRNSGAEETQLNQREFNLVVMALLAGESVLVLSEFGAGESDFASRIINELTGDLDIAIAKYQSSGKLFFQKLADQLGVETTEPKLNKDGEPVGDRSLTLDELKDSLLDSIGPETLFVLPDSKRLTTGVRYWLENAIANGVRVCCFAVVNPKRDIFLGMIEIELEPPPESYIREIMRSEAIKRGLQFSESELAELAPQAGRSPLVAKQVIKRRALGIKDEVASHTQYVNVTPLWYAFLAGLAVMRFVGQGTGQKDLQIFGGIAFMAFMTLKQLGQIKGSRRRLGQ